MATNQQKGWDEFYQHPDAFGAPYPELNNFLENLEQKRALLDLGCGQGRNSMLALKLGFQVTGVDYSAVGVDTMVTKSNHQIEGVVEDIYNYNPSNTFQVILLDAVIHCQEEDRSKEINMFKKLLSSLENEGFLLIITHQWDMRETYLKETIEKEFPQLKYQFNKHLEHFYFPPLAEEEHIMEMSFMCFKYQKND
ncbi:class I SAM-dependent methyltransferase [Flammeovirga agarivorans]|uniref:Class I SAM-dependent methyltransferase n=1 Tax=Flammeovirga agarivorans TaxID=2726742 RepID=A0A7X8SH31_9BACT|nr:class I SAM-dependent methyltransferase [Flammeovirga agarivorans]NLR90096.1 class I SAM-dependent methyltransferase [Flammeovirga agarivorans]